MKPAKIYLTALLLGVSLHTFAWVRPAANNNSEIVDRHLSGFNAIDAGGPFDVYIIQGALESVKVDAPASAMAHIMTEVKGSVLKLYIKNDTWHWGDGFGNKRIVVYVSAKNINAISATGSGDVFFKNGINANILRLDLSGSGDMTGKLNVRALESSLTGSGDLRISGSAGNEMIQMSGSGDCHARDVRTNTAAIHISGSGDAFLNVNSKLEASSSGSGDIRYTGSVRNVYASKSGSGDIQRD